MADCQRKIGSKISCRLRENSCQVKQQLKRTTTFEYPTAPAVFYIAREHQLFFKFY